jgi:hypothetical protein
MIHLREFNAMACHYISVRTGNKSLSPGTG